jgi:hypothetical protein
MYKKSLIEGESFPLEKNSPITSYIQTVFKIDNPPLAMKVSLCSVSITDTQYCGDESVIMQSQSFDLHST